MILGEPVDQVQPRRLEVVNRRGIDVDLLDRHEAGGVIFNILSRKGRADDGGLCDQIPESRVHVIVLFLLLS